MGWGRERILQRVIPGRAWLHGLGKVVVTILVAGLVGLGMGIGAAHVVHDDRVTVGYTGGTLSAALSIDNSLIVIGGGSSRADLADFVDRSTLPWRRHVDLLVVPAGDTRHVAGAVGLIQHGTVAEVAILGDPGSDSTWTLLRSEAARYHTSVTILTGQQRLALAPGRELVLDAGLSDDADRPGPSALLRYGQARIALVDWPTTLPTADATTPVPPAAEVLISLRADSPLGPSAASVFLRAAPSGVSVAGSTGAYVGDVAAGQRVTLGLRDDQIRLPAGAVVPAPG